MRRLRREDASAVSGRCQRARSVWRRHRRLRGLSVALSLLSQRLMLDGRQHFERQDRTAILKRSRFQLRCETGQTLRRPRRQDSPDARRPLRFCPVMRHLPLTTFRRCVARYGGEHRIKRFSCLDQYLCLAFAQLTWRESLRDIEACLRAQSFKLFHLGFRSTVARNTLANANAVRDWRIYADFAQHLIVIARRLYADDPLALELDETVYALDSTTIDLCLSVFPWAPFRSTKAAVKLHTLLDLRGNIPSF